MLYNMVDTSDDALQGLGLTALGSRLKRLGERLQAEAQVILDRVEPVIAAGQHPLLHTIDRFAPLPVGELAERLGVTQPGVTRTLAQLAEAGLVEVVTSPEDARRRLVSLTADGARFVEEAKRDAWPAVEAAVADLCGGFAEDLLTNLGKMEAGLDAKPLSARVKERDHET
jgi:DNA-binding MarR family transcriptional regulator